MLFLIASQSKQSNKQLSMEVYNSLKATFTHLNMKNSFKKIMGTTVSIVVSEKRKIKTIAYENNKLYINLNYYNKLKSNPVKLSLEIIKAMFNSRNNYSKTKSTKLNSTEKLTYELAIKKLYDLSIKAKSIPIPKDVFKGKTTKSGIFIPQFYVDKYAKLKNKGNLSLEAFTEGYANYLRAVKDKKIKKGKFIIIDFNRHHNHNRLYYCNFNTMEVKHRCKVSHGSGSDTNRDGWLDKVSNISESHMSSIGLYKITGMENHSKFGYCWRPKGLYTTNTKAKNRGILIHYLRGKFSWGCFGIPENDAKKMGMSMNNYQAPSSNWDGYGMYAYHKTEVQNQYKLEKKKK